MYQKIYKSFFLFLILFVTSCGARRPLTIDPSHPSFSFRFFIFIETENQKISGNGEAVIVKDELMKFHVMDNLLGYGLFGFQSFFGGRNEIIAHNLKIIYVKMDKEFSFLLTHYLYALLSQDASLFHRDKGVRFILDDKRIQKIFARYLNSEVVMEVQKFFESGKPKRVKIYSGKGTVFFDILAYEAYDFLIEKSKYQESSIDSQGSLLEWLGEWNAR